MQTGKTICFLLTCAAAAACADAASTPDAPTQVESSERESAGVSLRLTQARAGSGSLRYTLTNHTNQAVHVLRWMTPLENAPEKLFSVRQSGKEVRYTGSYGKRIGPPQDRDYVELPAGSELSADFDLSESHDLTPGGKFFVSYAVPAGTLIAESDRVDVLVDGEVSIEVDASEPRGADVIDSKEQALSTSGCNFSQYDWISFIHAYAHGMAQSGLSNYQNDPWNDSAMRWFNDAIYNSGTVVSRLNAIYNRINTENYHVVCDDGHPSCDGFIARAQDSHNVRLCSAFWSLPFMGTGSMTGVLLHELSHFEGAGDHAYGLEAAWNLAWSNPWTAAANAENYQFYYENAVYP
jgi:hypothetical protein